MYDFFFIKQINKQKVSALYMLFVLCNKKINKPKLKVEIIKNNNKE